MTITGLLIPANPAEPVQRITIPHTLDAFQAAVGGSFEMVNASALSANSEVGAYINEDGKHIGLPANERATFLLMDDRTAGFMAHDFIAGPLVLFGFDPNNGDDHDLPANFAADVCARLGIENLIEPERVADHGGILEDER